jgi:glycosyltransferase involved in cell wall biosynthesis
MILLIRASHANSFELQNYVGIKDLQVLTSQHPLTPSSLPSTKLWSLTDLPHVPYRRQILNRLIGGEQWLVGLEKYITRCSDVLKHENKKKTLIVHTAETYTPYTHQSVQLRKAGKIDKLISTCWETIPHANEKFARLRAWKAEAYQYVDLFHTPTQRAKQALVTEGVDPAKIVVIPYGVDLTRFHPVKRVKNKKPIVLMVARPVFEKGIDLFYTVAKRLAHLADFCLVSRASYGDMPAIYQCADLFFLPSRTTPTWEEQYGMALVEAMACGLPIVTTGSGAIPEVVGEAGITIPVCDVDKMVETIRYLLTNTDQLTKYSHLSHSRAQSHYSARKISAKLARLYT